MGTRPPSTRPPSKWWLFVGVVVGLLAAASFTFAVIHQSAATQPIGEGEVFVADVERAVKAMAASDDPDAAVRLARNDLGVEAVSLVDPGGTILASTSDTLSGQTLANSLLAYGAGQGRFAALAASVDRPIRMDGVVKWPAGSVLYHVISPVPDDDRLVLLHYDVSELLSRRAQPGDVQELTLQLVALGAIFAVLAGAVGIGHTRASRRHKEMTIESALLRDQAEELERVNADLAEARHRAERALALSEEKMRIRSEFVLMINHELRTPLTSVVTAAELLRSGQVSPAEGRELLEFMVSNGKRLNEMIDQILAVARIENRGVASELVTVPLEEVCAFVGVDRANGDESTSYEVHTDVRTLSLVLTSLADNAITHGANEVETRCVTRPLIVGAHRVGTPPPSPVYFVVSDDGPGIDPEFLPRAFEKFEKNSASSGTGIGLYMVQVMVEAIGGSIEVATSPRGTTFQIALPARAEQREMART